MEFTLSSSCEAQTMRRRASTNLPAVVRKLSGDAKKKKRASINPSAESGAEARHRLSFLVSTDASGELEGLTLEPCHSAPEDERKGLINHASSISEARAVLKDGVRFKHLTPRSKISVLECVDPHMSHFLQKRRILTLQHLASTTPQQVSKLLTESTAVSTVRMDKAIKDAHQIISVLKSTNPQVVAPSVKYPSLKKSSPKQNTLDKISSFFSLPFQ